LSFEEEIRRYLKTAIRKYKNRNEVHHNILKQYEQFENASYFILDFLESDWYLDIKKTVL